MKETASSYLDLHLEVARYFQRPEIEKMTKALKLLYNHTPMQGFMLLQSFPNQFFPFATEEQWEEWGRIVNKEANYGIASFVDEDGETKTVYSVQCTEGEPIPSFPIQKNPPEIDHVTYHRIFSWLDELREADGIKLIIAPNMHGNGGYNYKTHEIILPGATSKEITIFNYMIYYMASIHSKLPFELETDELNEYSAILNTCTYKVLKDKGYDLSEYGLSAILTSVETYDKYLELEEEIENILDYFEEIK